MKSSIRVLVPEGFVSEVRSKLMHDHPTFEVDVVPATGFEMGHVQVAPGSLDDVLGAGKTQETIYRGVDDYLLSLQSHPKRDL